MAMTRKRIGDGDCAHCASAGSVENSRCQVCLAEHPLSLAPTLIGRLGAPRTSVGEAPALRAAGS